MFVKNIRHQKNITKTYPSQYFFQNKQKKRNNTPKNEGKIYKKKWNKKKTLHIIIGMKTAVFQNFTNKTYPYYFYLLLILIFLFTVEINLH